MTSSPRRSSPIIWLPVLVIVVVLAATIMWKSNRGPKTETLIGRDAWSSIGGFGYVWLDSKRLLYLTDSKLREAYRVNVYDLDSRTSKLVSNITVKSPRATYPYQPNVINAWSDGRYLDVHEWDPSDMYRGANRDQFFDTLDRFGGREIVSHGPFAVGADRTALVFDANDQAASMTKISLDSGMPEDHKLVLGNGRSSVEDVVIASGAVNAVVASYDIDVASYDVLNIKTGGIIRNSNSDPIQQLKKDLEATVGTQFWLYATTVRLSPDASKVAWLISYDLPSGWLHDLVERVHPSEPKTIYHIYVTDRNSPRYREVAAVRVSRSSMSWRSGDPVGLRWTPDSKAVTFVEDGELKRVSVPPTDTH